MHPDLADYGPIRFQGDPNALYDRHLVFDYAIDPDLASPRERYEAVARSLRDVLALRWLRTKKTHYLANPKQAYYLSMEFLIGRSLASNVSNLLLDPAMREACREKNVDWYELLDQEPDAGLGNGGLGRLAACFIESMATLELPAMGYGLRYEYGIFKQSIRDGWQNEKPDNWLRRPDPWEVIRLDHIVEVHLNCSFQIRNGSLAPVPGKPSTLLGIPFDRPVVGHGGQDHQHASALGGRRSGFFPLPPIQSRRFRRGGHRDPRRGIHQPSPLPGRFDSHGPGASLPPGVLSLPPAPCTTSSAASGRATAIGSCFRKKSRSS